MLGETSLWASLRQCFCWSHAASHIVPPVQTQVLLHQLAPSLNAASVVPEKKLESDSSTLLENFCPFGSTSHGVSVGLARINAEKLFIRAVCLPSPGVKSVMIYRATFIAHTMSLQCC